MPFERDDRFIEREDVFPKIEKHLQIHHRVSLYGIGGVGYIYSLRSTLTAANRNGRKSQIAIEYAYRFRESRPRSHIFWIYAASHTRFVQAYRDIAQTLELSGCNDPQIDPCELLFKWLSQDDSGPWLLILDNADDTNLFFHSHELSTTEAQSSKPLIDYLPRKLDSHRLLVITTRSRTLGEDLSNGETGVEVPAFSFPEARELIRSKLKKNSELLDIPDMERLFDILGYIPLAISQAAAFMDRNRMSLREYLAALEKDERNLIDHLSHDLQDHRRERGFPNSVFRTLKLSFDQIQAQEPLTAQLLSLMAMLDRQRIPKRLISYTVERSVDFSTAIGTLNGFSLISEELGKEIFGMHRLVQLSVYQWLGNEDRKVRYARQALQLLAAHFPNGEHENKAKCESLLPHTQAVLKHKLASGEDQLHRAQVLYNISWFNWRQGRYTPAFQAISEAYNIYRERLGDIAITTLQSLTLFAWVLQSQGKYEAAEEMSRRALEGREKILGFEHLDTLTSVDILASIRRDQGRYEAAEEMNRRALEGREKILGFEHPDTLTSVDNLASVLRGQGKYEAAEEMNRRALEGREKILGFEHPDTLTSVDNLALFLRGQGKYEAAEEMNRRALEGREKILGFEHPDTLTSVDNLALFLRDQRKYEAAEEMNRRALEGREKILGFEHPDTLTSVDNLALFLRDQRKYEAAEEMNRRALEGSEKILGFEHPDTLTSVHNLASILQDQRKYEAAEEMNRRALKRKRKR